MGKQSELNSEIPNRLKPLSCYPLTPEQALAAFMQVKPKKEKNTTKLRGT